MKTEKKYLIYGIVIVLIVLISVSLAYFVTEIVGDKKGVSVTTGDLRIIFNNGEEITATDVYAEDGLDIIKTFSVENKTNSDYKYNIVIEDLVNTTVTNSLVYIITSDSGYYMEDYKLLPKSNSANDTILAYDVTIPSKSTHDYTIEIKYFYSDTYDQSEDMGKHLGGKLYITNGTLPSLAEAMLVDNSVVGERTDFDVTFTEYTDGVIFTTNKTEDDSTVYYYSGNTQNNWVKFGKEDKCMYDGNEVEYVDSETSEYREVNNSNECTITNVCLVKQPMAVSVYGDDGYIYSYYVGLSEEECQEIGTYLDGKAEWTSFNIYWRIIRTNEDGSVRLLYAGNSHDTTEGYIGSSRFNDYSDESIYFGYMYGGNISLEDNRANTTSSAIKTYLDNWYQNNLLTNYDKYISKSAIYCNDRSFGSAVRLTDYNALVIPSYKCGADANGGLYESTQSIEDKFSVSTTGGGNGQLTYGVALMTADEIVFAGGNYASYLPYPYTYYYTNSAGGSVVGYYDGTWWLLTPYSLSNIFEIAGGSNRGYYLYENAPYSNTVRPVLSIDPCAKVTGTGTPEDPYVIDESNSTC